MPVRQPAKLETIYDAGANLEAPIMASVYRRKETPFWWAQFVGYDGKRKLRSTRMRQKKMALRVAGHWETQHALVRAGIIAPEDIDFAERGREAPLDLLDQYLRGLPSAKAADDHRSIITSFCESRRVAIAREFGTAVIVTKIEAYLADVYGRGVQHRRVRDYLRAIRRFANFLWRKGYITSDWTLRADYVGGDDPQKIHHRALMPTEFARLINGDHGLYYFYRVWTGIRGEEVARQARGDLQLDDKPTIHVRREVAKNKLECVMPLAPMLAERLRCSIGMKHAGAVLFEDVPVRRESRDDMLQEDLVAAGIDSEGVNHRSFRKTFVTWLEAAGVEIGVRMKLRRDIGRGSERLTNWTYSDQEQVLPLLRDALMRTEKWYRRQLKERQERAVTA